MSNLYIPNISIPAPARIGMSKRLKGHGIPDNSLGYDGDTYVDEDGSGFYSKANGVWIAAGGGGVTPMAVDAFMDFRTQTKTQLLDLAQLTPSALGAGEWDIFSQSAFGSWKCVDGPDMNFKVPLSVAGQTIQSSGTKWARYDHGTGNPVESIAFYLPGRDTGNFQELIIGGFVKFAGNNPGDSQVNFDQIEIDGNPFTIFQEDTVNGENHLIPHMSGATIVGGEGSVDGTIPLDPTKVYFFQIYRNDVTGKFRIQLWDPTDWSLVGETIGQGTLASHSWFIRFQANYLDLGGVTGYYMIGGIYFQWTNVDPGVDHPLPPPPPPSDGPWVQSLTGGFDGSSGAGIIGYKFRPEFDLRITDLAYWFNSQSYKDAPVTLYDSAFNVLATVNVPFSGATLNAFTYAAITPLTIRAGSTYYILADIGNFNGYRSATPTVSAAATFLASSDDTGSNPGINASVNFNYLIKRIVLSISGGFLSWEYTGDNPDLWSIQTSNDSGVTWTEVDSIDGGDTSYLASLDPGYYSVVGLTGGVYGERSNTVIQP